MVLPVDFGELRSAISGEKRRANIFVRNAELLIDAREHDKNKNSGQIVGAQRECARTIKL
jgi:hypothetical protein